MTRRRHYAKAKKPCARCNSAGPGERHGHHVVPRSEKYHDAVSPEELAATVNETSLLCEKCHREWHRYCGIAPGATADEYRAQFAVFLATVPTSFLSYAERIASDEMTVGTIRQTYHALREWWDNADFWQGEDEVQS